MTRGIINNNPGNIRWGDDWQGLVAPSLRTDPSFCQFIASQWGIRAIAKILQSYRAAGIMTLRDAIHRWAPPSENDTDAYIQDVSHRSSIAPDDCIDLSSFQVCKGIVEGIIFHENGQMPYSEATISLGLSLAGITS